MNNLFRQKRNLPNRWDSILFLFWALMLVIWTGTCLLTFNELKPLSNPTYQRTNISLCNVIMTKSSYIWHSKNSWLIDKARIMVYGAGGKCRNSVWNKMRARYFLTNLYYLKDLLFPLFTPISMLYTATSRVSMLW